MKKQIKSASDLARKHPKKSVALASVLGTIVMIANFWGDFYRIVCPFLSKERQGACYHSGQAAESSRATVAGPLDNNYGEVPLDADPLDGGYIH